MPKFRAFADISSGSAVTLFQDSLKRTTGLGVNWMVGYADPTQASFFDPTVNTGGTGLTLGNGTGGGTSVSMLLQPTVLGAIIGLTQFAQVTLVSSVGSFSSAGPAVASQGDPLTGGGTANGYFANIQPPNTFLQVRRANVGQTLIQGNIGNSVANGIVVRISVVFGSGSNTIHLFVNGVEQPGSPYTDSGAGLPTTGLPGIFFKGAPAGTSQVLSTFSGGIGL